MQVRLRWAVELSNNLKKVLLICSHLQQFGEIIPPLNCPLRPAR